MRLHFKQLIRESEINIERSDATVILANLRYYLLSEPSESLFACECSEGMVYGVAIELKPVDKAGGSCLPENFDFEVMDCGFSYLREEAIDFINEIADFKVTPLQLSYIIDEYVSIF